MLGIKNRLAHYPVASAEPLSDEEGEVGQRLGGVDEHDFL